ncbi:MAG: hypothetical protein JKX96_09470, partial [Acinetobacter sp.]|nr:hypothetical protein [Acinetobacter sp.]
MEQIFGYIKSSAAGDFRAISYNYTIERQRPSILQIDLEVALERGSKFLFYLGQGEKISRKSFFTVRNSNQLSRKRFRVDAVEPVHEIYQLPVSAHWPNMTLNTACTQLAALVGFKFINKSLEQGPVPQDLIFRGDFRNALYQIRKIWKIKSERFRLDLFSSTLLLLPGALNPAPIVYDENRFVNEANGTLNLVLTPDWDVGIQIMHRHKMWIVDRVTQDSISQQSQLLLVQPTDSSNHARKFVVKAIPELPYSAMTYARITLIAPATGVHSRKVPIASAAIEILDHDLKKDLRFPLPLANIPLAMSANLIDPPDVGDTVLIAFPHGLASTGTVITKLLDGQKVQFSPGVVRLSAPIELIVGSGEDNMVLF